MKYSTPEIEMVKFNNIDVIQTSSNPEGGNTGESGTTGGNSGNNENQTPELDW